MAGVEMAIRELQVAKITAREELLERAVRPANISVHAETALKRARRTAKNLAVLVLISPVIAINPGAGLAFQSRPATAKAANARPIRIHAHEYAKETITVKPDTGRKKHFGFEFTVKESRIPKQYKWSTYDYYMGIYYIGAGAKKPILVWNEARTDPNPSTFHITYKALEMVPGVRDQIVVEVSPNNQEMGVKLGNNGLSKATAFITEP